MIEILKEIPDECVDTIVTSPPYWGMRDYGVDGQIGLEPTLDEYLNKLAEVTKELKRILKPTGVMFWNHGDCYGNRAGRNNRDRKNPKGDNVDFKITAVPDKCMILQNYRLILKMIDEQGWILRNIIIWYKPNHMPSSVKDRFTNAYEPIFMLVKQKKYWFDLDAVRIPHKTSMDEYKQKLPKSKNNKTNFEAGRGIIKYSTEEAIERRFKLGKNPSDVWVIPTQPFKDTHFAVFPPKLVERCLKCACPQWICRKCGHIRERIVKKITINAQDKRPDRGQIGYPQKQRGGNSIVYTIDWTDCGCNAGWVAGIVLDPFMGSGTTGLVAEQLNRRWIGIELNPKYCEMAKKRLKQYIGQKRLFIFNSN